MKRKRYLFVVALAFSLVLPSLNGFASESNITEETRPGFVAEGQVIGVLQFRRTPELDRAITPNRLVGTAWVRTTTHFQKTVLLTSFSVSLDSGEPKELDLAARFAIPLESSGPHVIRVFDPDGIEITTREVAGEEQTRQLPIVIVQDLADYQCHHETKDPGEGFESSGVLGPPPCLDYNGPFGNCVNYSSGWRKYANFVLSDCDLVMSTRGRCWTEVMPGHSCNHGGTNCSKYIGHSSSHHCH